jgi:tetratricopeptide (TPR) repeat protein
LLPPDETWPKAEAAGTKALELDPAFAQYYFHLRACIEFYDHRDWHTAERAFKRALELNPNDAAAHAHYSVFLTLVGRVEEALVEVRKALNVDPLSPGFIALRGEAPLIVPYWARKSDELIERSQQRVAQDPGDAYAHDLMGNAYEQKGMYKDAIAEWHKAMVLSHDDELAATLDRSVAESGYEGIVRLVWQKRLARLKSKVERGEYVAAGHFARIYARLADHDQALMWLDKASREGNRLMLEARIDPAYDALRSDPRFIELLRSMRLAP